MIQPYYLLIYLLTRVFAALELFMPLLRMFYLQLRV
jgi:hypothetical protein